MWTAVCAAPCRATFAVGLRRARRHRASEHAGSAQVITPARSPSACLDNAPPRDTPPVGRTGKIHLANAKSTAIAARGMPRIFGSTATIYQLKETQARIADVLSSTITERFGTDRQHLPPRNLARRSI